MKLLNGQDLAEFIKERQGRQVRALLQSHGIKPKLAIVVTIDNPIIEVYMRYKKAYGADMQIEVDIHRVSVDEALQLIPSLNKDDSVHGIIVQLPIQDPAKTNQVCDQVASEKDVDGLSSKTHFEPATPMAITWLLAGYNIDLRGKKILLIGRGKLVGEPLEKILTTEGLDVSTIDRSTTNLAARTLDADIIITATGSPAILYPEMIKQGAVVVDAGVASEDGKTVGDVHPSVYERDDLTITPAKGGVGPLTICALFENVIRAARMAL